jgi:transposase
LNLNKQPVEKNFQLDDTTSGHDALTTFLESFFEFQPDAQIYVGLESTGGYENNWFNHLCNLKNSMPLHVVRLNPARVTANSEAGAKHNKTDKISATDVAEYLISHSEKVNYEAVDSYPMLRRQWNFIQLNNKLKTQLLGHLESLLYSAMPELLTFCRQGVPDWFLKMLRKYSTYEALLNAGIEGLTSIPYLSTQKTKRLLELIQRGLGDSNQISGQIISTLSSQIIELDSLIKQHKKQLEENYQEAKPEVGLLRTFNGIGIYSAVGLLLNIPDGVTSFATSKKLSAFWGVHPVYKKSGDGSWGFHMSKCGRSQPRAILYMVAWSAIQCNPIIKELYAKCKAKGMPSNAALGVCMHKVLRIIYGILKSNTPFDPEIDRTNKKKTKLNSKPKSHDKKRNLQPFDRDAPISKRQHKKRKEQAQSQGDNIAKYGISEPAPQSAELDAS